MNRTTIVISGELCDEIIHFQEEQKHENPSQAARFLIREALERRGRWPPPKKKEEEA